MTQIREGIEISDEDAILYDEYIAKSSYYDIIQMVKKLALNSAYGALCNRFFRFFDLRLGASTTATGQEILRHQTRKVNELLTENYEMEGGAIIAGDTDSTYFLTFQDNEEDATKVGDKVGNDVNESFPEFMKDVFFCSDGYDTLIKTEREVIGSSSIFIKKKNYIIKVVNMEGKKCSKLKSMGISLKKTTLPKEYQIKLGSYIDRILDNEEWIDISRDIVEYKTELSHIDNLMRIGLPKGVKGVDKYSNQYMIETQALTDWANKKPFKHKDLEFVTDCKKSEGWSHQKDLLNDKKLTQSEFDRYVNAHIAVCLHCRQKADKDKKIPWKSRLPGHVSASIHWNECLKMYNDRNSIEIVSGTKIKVYYLKSEFLNRFSSIAIPTDTTKIPQWLIDNYKEHVDIDAQLDRLIDKSLEAILHAIGKSVPSRQSLLVHDLMDISDVDKGEIERSTIVVKKQKKKKEISDEQKSMNDDLFSF